MPTAKRFSQMAAFKKKLERRLMAGNCRAASCTDGEATGLNDAVVAHNEGGPVARGNQDIGRQLSSNLLQEQQAAGGIAVLRLDMPKCFVRRHCFREMP